MIEHLLHSNYLNVVDSANPPSISVYDYIGPTDSWKYSINQFTVQGTWGNGAVVTVKKGSDTFTVVADDNDTPESIAAKIVAAWNQINPDPANKVNFKNDQYNVANPVASPGNNMIQLISKQGEFSQFYVTVDYTPPPVVVAPPVEPTTETVTTTVVEPEPVVVQQPEPATVIPYPVPFFPAPAPASSGSASEDSGNKTKKRTWFWLGTACVLAVAYAISE